MHLVSESQEIQLGEQQYQYLQQVEGGPFVTYPDVQKYVESIGMKIAAVSDRPHLPYEFVVLNNSIPNAWALPGGKDDTSARIDLLKSEELLSSAQAEYALGTLCLRYGDR